MRKLTCVNHKQTADRNHRKKKTKHHGDKSPFERHLNANRKIFYQSQVKKKSAERRPFPENRYTAQRFKNSYHSSENLFLWNVTTLIGKKAKH